MFVQITDMTPVQKFHNQKLRDIWDRKRTKKRLILSKRQ